MKNKLKLIIILLITIMSCEKDVDKDPEIVNHNITVFTNQSGNPSFDGLQAQFIDSENSSITDVYGNFNIDGTPNQISKIRYTRIDNDTIVNIIIDKPTNRIKSVFHEVNGERDNVITRWSYTDNPNEVILSVYDYDWDNEAGMFLYSFKYTSNNSNRKARSGFAKADWVSILAGVGGGIAVAELAGAVGGGFTLAATIAGSAAVGTVAAAVAAVAVPVIVVASLAIILSSNASASDLTPQNTPYPTNTPVNNPLPVNTIPNLPGNPCLALDCSLCAIDVNNSAVCIDCNGDINGTATMDDCEECVGGNTQKEACVADCNGELGGTATMDACDECVGGNTGKTECTEFTDTRDGQVYKFVTIGNQIWMAENLNYVTGNSRCYDDLATNCNTYGRLYDYQTALTAIPAGWHVPSEAEWEELIDYLGGFEVAGGKLKEVGTTHWNYPNIGATNVAGFKALPAGSWDITDTEYGGLGYYTSWWCTNEDNGQNFTVWGWDVFRENTFASNIYSNEGFGRSVRCVKD